MNNGTQPVFDCKRCGNCCTGEGGIVASPGDQARLAAHLGLSVAEFLHRYAYERRGKWLIRTGEDGRCVFFKDGIGCSVHGVKPVVCRAWPFFRGNLVDAISFAMAKGFCPGIAADASHESFVAEGKAYLRENGLEAHDASCEANALISAGDSK